MHSPLQLNINTTSLEGFNANDCKQGPVDLLSFPDTFFRSGVRSMTEVFPLD